MILTIKDIEHALPFICSRDTSADRENWKPGNPLYGHCGVVTTLIFDLFGGSIKRVFLEHTPIGIEDVHYWNILPDGTEVDLTKKQYTKFPGIEFEGHSTDSKGDPLDREYMLKWPDTKKRYDLFKRRFQMYFSVSE